MQVFSMSHQGQEIEKNNLKKGIRKDTKWVQTDPVTLVPRPIIKACLGLFLISYQYEQERSTDVIGGDGGWQRRSKGDEKGQMGGCEGR